MKKYILSLCLVSLLLTGCRTIKDIEVVHDTIVHTQYITNIQHDSIYVDKDKYVYLQGDTVYTKETEYKYVYKFLKDTVITHDTVPGAPIVVKETEYVNKPQWWPVWLTAGLIALVFGIKSYIKKGIIFKIIDYIINLFK